MTKMKIKKMNKKEGNTNRRRKDTYRTGRRKNENRTQQTAKVDSGRGSASRDPRRGVKM